MRAGVEMLEVEDKRRILDELLQSPAFGRSDQLRQMLRYIVEEELGGRGDQLSEHAIGVNALGRPADYAPEVDSSVRTRAHELRKRMEEHFRGAAPAGWRIELPKGSYRAKFVRVAEPVEAAMLVPAPANAQNRSHFWRGVAVGAIALLAIGLAGRYLWPQSEGERAARQIWGPLLDANSSVSVMLANTNQLWIREFGNDPPPLKDPPIIFPVPDDPRFVEWYRRTALLDPKQLILHPNNHSPLGGEAEAAVRLAAFLATRGVRVEMLHGDRAAEMKDRNAVVLGRPEYSRAAAALQPADGFSVRYVPGRREMGIVSADGQQTFFRENGGTINYGLITVLTKRTDAGPRRTLLFAGINSDGSDAAMEHVTSLLNLTDLVRELKKTTGELPNSFQVVVRSRSNDTRTLQSERAAIKILP